MHYEHQYYYAEEAEHCRGGKEIAHQLDSGFKRKGSFI